MPTGERGETVSLSSQLPPCRRRCWDPLRGLSRRHRSVDR